MSFFYINCLLNVLPQFNLNSKPVPDPLSDADFLYFGLAIIENFFAEKYIRD